MKRDRKKHSPPDAPPAPGTVFRGLWRDGNWLVIDLHDHRFPRRCVKTNRPVEKPSEPVRLYYRPEPYSIKHWLREGGSDIYSALLRPRQHGNRGYYPVDLLLPLSPAWRSFVTWPWGPRIAAVGVYATIASFLLIVAAGTFRWIDSSAWFWPLGLSVGLIALGFGHQVAIACLFPVKRNDEGQMWIGGVHREWLRPLPVFVPSRRALEQSIFDAKWRLWTSWGVGIFLTGMVIALGVVGATREAGARPVVLAYLVVTAIVLGIGIAASTKIKRAREQIGKNYQLPNKRRRQRGKRTK
jgi:hypothetical protein